jgi:urease accessory protein
MRILTLSTLLATLAVPALAHTGHGDASGFAHGFAHPILGPDHLVAMLAVGLWSGFVLPARIWAGAVAFMAAMGAGAGLAWAGVALPMVEPAILASVVAFGLLTLMARPGQAAWVTGLSLAVIAAFATFHGYAHAAEAAGGILAYLAGFLLATGGLHLAGIGLARALTATGKGRAAQSALGAAVAGAGLFLMAS